MRLLRRNKRRLFYANLVGYNPIIDEYGNETGEKELVYSEKIPYSAIVTVATTSTNAYVDRTNYGNDESYQLSVICPKNNPFNSETVFWIDDLDAEEYDYQVIGMTTLVNQCFVTVKKINVKE